LNEKSAVQWIKLAVRDEKLTAAQAKKRSARVLNERQRLGSSRKLKPRGFQSRPARDRRLARHAAAAAAAKQPSRKDVAVNAAFLLVLLVVWQLVSAVMRTSFVPGPLVVFQAFVTLAVRGDYQHVALWRHCLASLERLLAGFAAGVILACRLDY
jgi:hypothetical protein